MQRYEIPPLQLRVSRRKEIADAVLLVELESVDGRRLPGWTPGAHLEVRLPSGLLRHYSLCGDPADRGSYSICVLREESGRGGSLELHRDVHEDAVLEARPPRNHFVLEEADSYLLVAGGIGVTPIKAMAEELQRRGADWRLVYGGRSLQSMAFVEELCELAPERVSVVPQNTLGVIDVSATMASAGEGTHVYACGPAGMLDAITLECTDRGIADRLHVERFTAASSSGDSIDKGHAAFEVELATTGVTVRVETGQSILEACLAVRSDLDYSCMEGYCGSCESRVLAGEPDHQGTLMSPEEHDEEGTMLICVGRSNSARLVLEL